MIAWKYLNKQSATINALRDYENMLRVIEITPEEIKAVQEAMSSPPSAKLDGMPHQRNIRSGESMLCKAIDKLDVLSERYKQAVEFMNWFKPAWDSLDEEEQLLLREFYLKEQSKTYASIRLADMLNYEERQIRRLRDKAVAKLTLFLFGG